MATHRKMNCRTHPGGKFVAPQKAGRPPVRCDLELYPCTASTTAVPTKPAKLVKSKTAGGIEFNTPAEPDNDTQERLQATMAARDASLAKAKKAKRELLALGWTVDGKGSGTQAEITAVRGDEMVIMVWDKGALITSTYSIWATDKPRENGMPARELPDDLQLDTLSDRELVALLKGSVVSWWNRLGSKRETAVVSARRIAIEHVYDEAALARGTEPSERIVKFADHEGAGFKAFRLDALLKIGS